MSRIQRQSVSGIKEALRGGTVERQWGASRSHWKIFRDSLRPLDHRFVFLVCVDYLSRDRFGWFDLSFD